MVHFVYPHLLWALALIPLFIMLFIWSDQKRVQALRAFGANVKKHRRRRESITFCVALFLIIVALARPSWSGKNQMLIEESRDVIFLLDVSRSMLAKDLNPNRLERAKTAILGCVEGLSSDRIALVLFAGSAEIRCPLTTDYDYFRMALRETTTESVLLGGTYIPPAIDKVTRRLMEPDKAGLIDLILITDGEDMTSQEEEIKIAKKFDQAGGRLIIIGIGNRLYGKRIRVDKNHFLKHKNEEVWTHLHSELLQKMAKSTTDGIYFEVADNPFDLREIYRQIMQHAQRSNQKKQFRNHYEERFHYLLIGAVLVLLWAQRRRVK